MKLQKNAKKSFVRNICHAIDLDQVKHITAHATLVLIGAFYLLFSRYIILKLAFKFITIGIVNHKAHVCPVSYGRSPSEVGEKKNENMHEHHKP